MLVNACLVGENCKYNGKNNKNEKILEFIRDKNVILVCPEVMGGLDIPRLKSEIVNHSDVVINENGEDVTDFFVKGAKKALKKALDNDVKLAVLKQKSPSCGYKKIYNGKFNGTIINGNGIFARMLEERKIKILTEEDFS